jgi:hypothetical protein
VYTSASICGVRDFENELDTLDMIITMNNATIGAVNDPRTIENIQVGPYGDTRTPMKLMITDNAISAAHDFGVKTRLASSVIFFHF